MLSHFSIHKAKERIAKAGKALLSRVKPKPPYEFAKISDDFRQRLENPRFAWPTPPDAKSDIHALVLITPWVHTAVPYYNIEIGRALTARGAKVRYLWDAENILFGATRPREVQCIESVMQTLGKEAEILGLPQSAPEGPASLDEAFLREFIYESSVRQAGGETGAKEQIANLEQEVAILRRHIGRIARLLREHRPDFVLIPGGFFGACGLYVLACQATGIAYTTYDSGPGEIVFAHNAIAGHFHEMADVFLRCLPMLTPQQKEATTARAHERLHIRRAGKDAYRLQPQGEKGTDSIPCDILVPLNWRKDTAALWRQRLFPSVRSWIEALLTWAEKTEAHIVIRQHPCERLPECSSSDDWDEILQPFQEKLKDRLRFVSAWDSINSYDLLDKAKVVLPYTSRVGVEAALLKIPTVLCAQCYYENLGFSHSPDTRENYFDMIEKALEGKLPVSDESQERAAFFYFLAEECALIPSYFTPNTTDYFRWVQATPQTLITEAEMDFFLNCLLKREAMPFLLFQRAMAQMNNE